MTEYVDSLGLHFYWRATNTVMVASTLVMLNCFLACCGAYYSNKPVLIGVSRESVGEELCERNVQQAYRTMNYASNFNQSYCSGGILVLAFLYVRFDSLFRVCRG